MEPPMDLICYLRGDWEPTIRPAEATREWMDQTKRAFAYRCLPLNIANAHGWEILCPISFDALWTGGAETSDIAMNVPPNTPAALAPVSIFGEGVLTFHINGVFRTPPGWNLWVGGAPNSPKDAIYPLTGVIETDWSPYSFTMNWRFTRADHLIHFEAGEPICFIFPVQREILTTVLPRFLPIEADPALASHHSAFEQSRRTLLDEAQQSRATDAEGEQWQKRYFRGVDMADHPVVPDHRSRLRLEPFAPIDPDAEQEPDPIAPIVLRTDTATLGRAVGQIVAAIGSGALEDEQAARDLAKELGEIGLGQSEALEVINATLAWVDDDDGDEC
jgi:Family of unknown function (DUF6065)